MPSGRVKRREFITLVGGAAAWPIVAHAQQPARLPIIGFIGAQTPSLQSRWTAAFNQRLRELGWIEGRTVTVEARWAEGSIERAADIAAEFVHLRADVIFAAGSNIIVAQKATSSIPIVFVGGGDPVVSGYVASLARPGGNLTGLSLMQPDLAGKRLELLREVAPAVRRLAVLANADARVTIQELSEVRAAARTLGLEVDLHEILRAEEIIPALLATRGSADGLYVCADPLLTVNRVKIIVAAAGVRLPSVYSFREYVDVGGLVSYGPNFTSLYRHAGDY